MTARLGPVALPSLISLHARPSDPSEPSILSIGNEPFMRFLVEKATGESIQTLRSLLHRTIQAVLTDADSIPNASSLFAFIAAFLNSAPR